jgi:hypothetical protein
LIGEPGSFGLAVAEPRFEVGVHLPRGGPQADSPLAASPHVVASAVPSFPRD